ncbi:F-box/kelch-repeat protein At3g23880-like [Cornus florida]|uniref:F-box/kelch-repeat protein At3g23880-like n=1 Tax=Cornus florida TaxID=4283 RepID=UPI00289DECF2|nr:F-box/kelch-repeat protein At3g23880-like [Cornus florida]
MASNGGYCHVPEDSIVEILSRLHVKSLIRFSCVCKYWYSLIRNSTFINKHHHHHTNHSRLIVQHYNFNIKKFAFALFPDENLSSLPYAYNDINEIQYPCNLEVIIGPFGGIFGLFNSWPRDSMALWNPATKEFRPLTPAQPNFPPHIMAFMHIFGFGVDPITNDYKVVWMRYFYDEEKDIPFIPKVIAVYNLGIDSWRLFEYELIVNRSIRNSYSNTYINGSYYWLASKDFRNYTLLSFDMSTENFKEGIPTPPNLSKSLCGDLTMYNDFIAMILFDPNKVDKSFYVWVMKEEGFWTKKLSIGPLLDILRPLGIWKNSELLLESSTSQLVLYNHRIQGIKNLGPCADEYCLRIFIYKESLVSVKGVDECLEMDNLSYSDRVQDFFHFVLYGGDQS